MDELNSLNLTAGAVLAALIWAIGGTIDGHGLRSLVAVPLLVGAWMCAIFVVDRWVMRGTHQTQRRDGPPSI
jgi:hypothetical protein